MAKISGSLELGETKDDNVSNFSAALLLMDNKDAVLKMADGASLNVSLRSDIAGKLDVGENCRLNLGELTVRSNNDVTIGSGSTLTINGSAALRSSNIELKSNALLEVKGALLSSEGVLDLNGVGASLQSAAVRNIFKQGFRLGADTTAQLGGDLEVTGGIVVGSKSTLAAGGDVSCSRITMYDDCLLKMQGGDLTAAGYVYLYGAGATLQGGRNLKVASLDMAAGTHFDGFSGDITATYMDLRGGVAFTGSDRTIEISRYVKANDGDLSFSGKGVSAHVTEAITVASGQLSVADGAAVKAQSISAGGNVVVNNAALTTEGELQRRDSKQATVFTFANHAKVTVGTNLVSAGSINVSDSTVQVNTKLSAKDVNLQSSAELTVNGIASLGGTFRLEGASVADMKDRVDFATGGSIVGENAAFNVAKTLYAYTGDLSLRGNGLSVNVASTLDVLDGKLTVTDGANVKAGWTIVGGDFELNNATFTTTSSLQQREAQISRAHFTISNHAVATIAQNFINQDLVTLDDATVTVMGNMQVKEMDVCASGAVLNVSGSSTAADLRIRDGATVNLNGSAGTALTSLTLNSGNLNLLTPEGSIPERAYNLRLASLTVAGNSVLEGNLVMAAGSTMHFAEDAVLTMGCSVSIGVGSSLEIDNYDPFRSYVLFKDVETLVLGNYVVTEEGVYDVSGLLTGINGVTNIANNLYGIDYHDGVVTFVQNNLAGFSMMALPPAAFVPEPATATLSLLALAALAARRKRKA